MGNAVTMKPSAAHHPDGTPEPDPRRSFQRFTDAARHVFNDQKSEFDKLAAKQKQNKRERK